MPNSSTQLTPNLLVSQSELYEYNSGFFFNGGQACIIDPGILPAEVDSLALFMKSKGISPEAIVLTHAHWDHLMQVTNFPNIKVIAHENYRFGIEGKAGERICQQIERLEAEHEITRPQKFVIPKPDETFSESLSLRLGDITLQLLHSPGHAADHLSVYVPEDGTLWAGDILSDSEIPYVIHNLSAYEASLVMLSSLEITALVPGHGTATKDAAEIDSRMKADRKYLVNLREQVTMAVSNGLSVTETVEACTDFEHPSLEENGRAHQMNIESVYIDLGGEADPTKFGWNQSFE
jgi:glyoxylase-like metal-dependent hydrolase (beta-lactamase superfamily II)